MNYNFTALCIFCFTLTSIADVVFGLPHIGIVNGYKVNISEVPYQAAIREKFSWGWVLICGAAIIHRQAVVTAAHCVEYFEKDTSLYKVVVGTSNRQGGQEYDVAKFYYPKEHVVGSLLVDIALVVTRHEIVFSNLVQSINLPSPNLVIPDGTEALVSGYGTLWFHGPIPKSLRAAKVYTVSQNTCRNNYLHIDEVTSKMLCAASSDPPRDACQGDSGGPLVANNTLIGIVSWGEGCADPRYPGVYVRVSNYTEFIRNKLKHLF